MRKQIKNPMVPMWPGAKGPYMNRIGGKSYARAFNNELACFSVISATIGDPNPEQTIVCFNVPPDVTTCGVVHPDTDFWFFNNGGNMNITSYSGPGPGSDCLTFNTADTTEGNGIGPSDVVTMDYALNSPGACHKAGDSDPECILGQIIKRSVTNRIYGITAARVEYTDPSLVIAEFASPLGTVGLNWLVVVNAGSVTVTDASIVGGDLHFTLAAPIVETDVVTVWHTDVSGGAVAADGRSLYEFTNYPVDNQVDDTAPSIPDNFSAVAVWYDQVDLSWDVSTDTGSGVKEYVIYREFVEVDRVTHPTTTYQDTGLAAETAYTYFVTAVDNADNESNGSTPSIATTFQPAPLVVAAEVGNVADNIVVVTFDREVVASNYATGWSFTEDAVGVSISSSAKTLATEVQFTLSADITTGTTVAYNYNSSSGDYANTDTVPMASDSGSVTNNVISGPVIPDFHGYGADVNGWIRGLVLGDGSLTFARASGATIEDFEGLVKTCLPDELRIKSARRVQNLLGQNGGSTEDITTWAGSFGALLNFTAQSATLGTCTGQWARALMYHFDSIEGHIYRGSLWLRNVSGNTAMDIYHSDSETGTSTPITIDGTLKRYSVTYLGAIGGGSISFGLFDTNAAGHGQIEITKAIVEDVTGQADQNQAEYVSMGLESGDYHGVGVDGVAYFNYENGNTVASNVVTEAKGSDLTTDWGALYEPAATNYADTSDDLTGGAETVDLTAAGTGDYTLSVKGTAAVTVAAGTATGTGFGQATDGSDITFNLSVAGTVTLTLNSGTLGTSQAGDYLKQVEKSTVASSFIPAPGGTANRTADDGSPSFDYSNWSQTAGSWIVDVQFSNGAQNAADEGIYSVNNAAGSTFFHRNWMFSSTDGTTQIDRSITPQTNGNVFRGALDFGGSTRSVGSKDVTGAGSYAWTDGAYDGAFVTNSVFNMVFTSTQPVVIRDLYGYKTRQGKTNIESNY